MVPLKNTSSLQKANSLIDVCARAHQCNSLQKLMFLQLLHFKVGFLEDSR